jgi:hypothetical protein
MTYAEAQETLFVPDAVADGLLEAIAETHRMAA